jgi:hypothetical protein
LPECGEMVDSLVACISFVVELDSTIYTGELQVRTPRG